MKTKFRDVSVEQRKAIAEKAGIDKDVLRHLQKGRRPINAAVARLIEKAAKHFGLDIPRESMCEACRKCELAKKARSCE
jgi:hypothetical protein